jgi:hypothetical protein
MRKKLGGINSQAKRMEIESENDARRKVTRNFLRLDLLCSTDSANIQLDV